MDPNPADAHPTRDLGLLLATAFNAYVNALHARLLADGLEVTGPYDGYLFRILHDQGRATVSELGVFLGVTKQAASQAVQSLQRRGLVVVEADGTDARRRQVRLSEQGERLRSTAVAVADEVEAQLVERLGARRVDAGRQALDALIDITAADASPLVHRLAAIGR